MNSADYASMRESLTALQEQLNITADDMNELRAMFADDQYLSVKAIGKYIASLQRYQNRAKELERYIEKTGESFTTITDIDDYIKAHEPGKHVFFIQSIVPQFFRLSSKDTKAQNAIEEAKNQLKTRLEKSGKESIQDTQPYNIVIEKIQKNDRASYEDLEIIQKSFGTIFMAAFDRGDLFIKQEYEPELLLTDTDNDLPIINTAKEETKPDLAPENIRNINQYYISIERNIPASALKLIDFQRMVEKKPDIPVTLRWFADEKLYHTRQEQDFQNGYYVPNSETIQYLLNHGYLTKMKITGTDTEKEYLTLSSKGLAVYTKDSTQKYLEELYKKRNEPGKSYLPEEDTLIPVHKWNAHNALQASLIHTLLSEQKINYILSDISVNEKPILIAISLSEKPEMFIAIVDIDEIIDSDEIETYKTIAENSEIGRITFLVYDKQDIEHIAEILNLSSDVSEQRRFCVAQDSFSYYHDN